MTTVLFESIISNGGGYDNLISFRTANGDEYDFVGEGNEYKPEYKQSIGGEDVIKKPSNRRNKKTGEYDCTGFLYVPIGEICEILMADRKTMDVASWRI